MGLVVEEVSGMDLEYGDLFIGGPWMDEYPEYAEEDLATVRALFDKGVDISQGIEGVLGFFGPHDEMCQLFNPEGMAKARYLRISFD